MKPFIKACWILTLLVPALARGGQFKFATQTLTVPDGFEVELVGGPPLVERPISASFDEQGRLYVTDSSGSNDKVEKQLAEKPNRVMCLEDTDGDGRFDASHVFADHLMFPEGCLWFDGSLYVSGPPSIWKLTDANRDGMAEERSEWHEGKTLTGCANDLHGPYLGLDGWIYWCKGAFARQTYEWPGKKPFSTRAAHIFRARPDHSDMEPVLTGGMDNPVGVAFTLSGERILCGTFFIQPEAAKRDGLIHAVYGGVYGKVNGVTDEHKKTGDLMPVMTHLSAAAPCSVIRYESAAFGEDYRDNLLVCCFNLHKVLRHVLEPDGATFKTKDSDFVTSDNTDFHPTEVLEDADGSILVVDTGGWYKLCCPTSQLSKPDVLGAIYRVRRSGAPKVEDPRGLKLAWASLGPDDLVKLLADPRPAVRKRAMQQLAKAGPNAIPPLVYLLENSPSTTVRCHALWTLTRIDGSLARFTVRAAISDKDETVAHAALSSVSLWRDNAARSELVKVLQHGGPQLQRIAAEALGRIGDARAVPALLAASAHENDRVLEHSLIYALIEIANPDETRKGLAAADLRQQRAALIALDQMDGGGLEPERVAGLLGSPHPLLRDTATWLAGHHPEWGNALAGALGRRLQTPNLATSAQEELKQQLAQFSGSDSIQKLIAARLNDPATAPGLRQLLLQAIAAAGLRSAPVPWNEAVGGALKEHDPEVLAAAITAARALGQAKTNAPDFSGALLRIGRESGFNAQLRLNALAALAAPLTVVEPGLFDFLRSSLDRSQPVLVRDAAATVLGKATLANDQLLALAETLKTVGPLELVKLLDAFAHSSNENLGLKVLAALKDSASRASLRADLIKILIAKYPSTVQQQGQELITLLNADSAKQSAHLEELLTSLQKGDIRRGQALFNSPRTACSICHTIGYLGGKVGPDLTTIGQVRTERDLLESIVYPSASFVRSYEPVVVKTKAEDEYNGVIRRDAPEEIVLATGPGTEVRIARADIVEMRPGTVSVMPAGLAEQLTKQELSDLVAFLKATKWGAN